MNPQSQKIREGSIADKRNQIMLALKNLEHGMSEFHGQWVFEDSEEDMLCEIIDTAFMQLLQSQRESELKEIVEEIEKLKMELPSTADDSIYPICVQHYNDALQEIKSLITNKLK